MNVAYILGGLALAFAAVVYIASICKPSAGVPVKSHDAIDEEIRRERIELHNASLDYAELQGVADRHRVVMLAAAFRMGAQWQQRRE